MFAYIDIKLIQSGSSDLRAAIEAKHVVVNDVPPPVEKANIKPAENLKDPEKIAIDIEKRFTKAVAEREDAIANWP